MNCLFLFVVVVLLLLLLLLLFLRIFFFFFCSYLLIGQGIVKFNFYVKQNLGKI